MITHSIRSALGLTVRATDRWPLLHRSISSTPFVFVCGISRSGTTLLATILDAHSAITMGYELLPPIGLDALAVEKLVSGETGDDLEELGRRIKRGNDRSLGVWLLRCHRAGVSLRDLENALGVVAQHPRAWPRYRHRLRIAAAVMEAARRRNNTPLTGFKLTGARFEAARLAFPNARFAGIVRDPRDVVASQHEREFGAEAHDIAASWCSFVEAFSKFAKEHPERAYLLRYEDLVTDPSRTVKGLFSVLPVPFEEEVLSYEQSGARVLSGGHANSQRLSQGIFPTSVGRWRNDLSFGDINTLVERAGAQMERHGYGIVAPPKALGSGAKSKGHATLPPARVEEKTAQLLRMRKFSVKDYARLLDPYGAFENLTYVEYVRESTLGDREVLLVRHDVDHDYTNALRLARWEFQRGVRATYCVLHTAWYYGELNDGRHQHTQEMADFVLELHSLGHEINFHNNAVCTALRTGADPRQLLEDELGYLRSLGVPVVGTSTHGDALCREHSFRNWEIFRECCDERFGGPRTLSVTIDGTRREVALGELPMADLGLEYEAYDIARDVYHTDSGGRQRTRHNCRGRRPFGREEGRGKVVGILAHPVWWDLGG